ncbi:MAG: DUF2383 domain-containing protein [Hoeflea sp.]|uniref:DUF2383 domain-containing protein n=1 Tax=Hoeflea sp. TaxID=1940281 RepID=UPI00273137D2|nr:DUF2383 domain-containing protein [Hoeflea sp.]MDP2121876.1 DUF2383 domain-containing protein [Hoeflea sp.]MDZ7602697.1 DUF2383 domain-containing protein [Hoeflea sp.]
MSSETIDVVTAEVLDAVGDTHIALIDAVHGYDVMLEKAEPEIRTVLETTRETTDRQAGELAQFLVAHGRHPSEDGSFMSTVHEGVVRTRAFFTDLDGDVLPAVVDGERRIVSSYDDAIEALAKNRDSVPAGVFDAAQALLLKHRSEIEDVIRRLDARHHALED